MPVTSNRVTSVLHGGLCMPAYLCQVHGAVLCFTLSLAAGCFQSLTLGFLRLQAHNCCSACREVLQMSLQLMACLFDGLMQFQANAEKHVNLQGPCSTGKCYMTHMCKHDHMSG